MLEMMARFNRFRIPCRIVSDEPIEDNRAFFFDTTPPNTLVMTYDAPLPNAYVNSAGKLIVET